MISRISPRSEPTMGSPLGVKTRHQIVLERLEHAELRREMPISPETMMSLVKRYCAIDNTGEDAVSYSEIIQEVLQADSAMDGTGANTAPQDRVKDYLADGVVGGGKGAGAGKGYGPERDKSDERASPFVRSVGKRSQ